MLGEIGGASPPENTEKESCRDYTAEAIGNTPWQRVEVKASHYKIAPGPMQPGARTQLEPR